MLVNAVPTRADALIRTLSVAGHQGLACLDYHADLRSLDATPSSTALAWCDSLFIVPGEAQMVPAQMVPELCLFAYWRKRITALLSQRLRGLE